MKKIYILFLFIFVLFNISNVNANIDQTNAFNFTYDCINWQWILKTDFNLWWHHHYYRQYHINKPWIIEIADSNHTTVAKSTNISIDGCNYVPDTCHITNEWNWEYLEGEDKIVKELKIDTNVEISRDWNNIFINGSWSNDLVNINFDENYTWTWKNLELELLDDKINLLEYWYNDSWALVSQVVRTISFQNRNLAWKKEYYYEISNDNKNIKLKQRKFKKVSSWIAYSSDNEYDIYSAYDWSNTGGGTCSDPKWKSNNWYCTWLDYWDYTQHHYTTTKVKLYRVQLSCTKIEYSDWTASQIITEAYDWTLWGIIQPIFNWPIIINWISEWNWWVFIFANNSLNIQNLKYEQVWKIWNRKLWVKKIKITIKQNDITLWEDERELNEIKDDVGNFPELNNIILKNDSWNIVTRVVWDYQIVFTFFDENNQQLGTYETPLTILPTNNLQTLSTTTDKIEVYASNNDSDKIKVCTKITDEFGNEINKEYSVNNSYVQILDWIKDLNNTEALQITNSSFKNSEFCFDINSLVPANKILKFNIKVPLHKQQEDLQANWEYKNLEIETSKINFKAPIEISEFKISEWWFFPEIWKEQTYKINLSNLWNIVFTNGDLDINETYVKNTIAGHKWIEFTRLLNTKFYNWNLSFDIFKWKIDAEDNILKAPWVKLENLPISYNIWGQNVKYPLNIK